MLVRQLAATGVLVAAITLSLNALDASPDAIPDTVRSADADAGVLPGHPSDEGTLAFEANVGQTADEVAYLSRGKGYTLFLTPAEAVLSLSAPMARADEGMPRSRAGRSDVVRMSLANANPAPQVAGEAALPGTIHYMKGNDPAKWHRDVPNFAKVRYSAVYPGIDAVYYGNRGALEYDFVVSPGADPSAIGVSFDGVDALRVDEDGNLRLALGQGELVQQRPIAYQEVGGVRRMVEAAYTLLGDATVGFALGAFDASLPLVIDPVLSYSTYLGGNASDHAGAITVDQAGNTWVTGVTDSVIFPWANGIDSDYGGGDGDAYVCRFTAIGGIPLCAYVGGDGWDEGFAIAIGPDGSAHVAGYTESFDFPVLFAQQPFPLHSPRPEEEGGGHYGDAFLLKITQEADGLAFSTYFGGNSSDYIREMTVGADGGIYVTGSTWSWEQFPVTQGAFQTQDPAGQDAFVTRFGPNGNLEFSTFLGGSGEDAGRGITLDATGRVYVAGYTASEDFPTRAPLNAVQSGNGDAFVAILDADGGDLAYGTYLGGSGEDWGYGIVLDAAGYIHLAGFTYSADFPVRKPLQGYKGDRDGFVARLSPEGDELVYGTYLGGSDMDDIRHIQLDPAGNMHVAGYTRSPDFPLAGPLMARGAQDSVVMKLAANGSSILFSTPVGGSDYEVLTGLALDRDGVAHIAGWTASADYPLANPVQGFHVNPPTPEEGGEDTFLTRIADGALDTWRGDFDGDGEDDVLWRNIATGQGAIWFSGDKTQGTNITRVKNLDWRIVGVGDFNADGRDDILWRNVATGAGVIWHNGDGKDTRSITRITNLNWKVKGVGDFDGDGTSDILWQQDTNGQVAVWYGGHHATSENLTRVTNLAWDIVGTGDFDGNGKDDILWRNASNGRNTIWLDANSRSATDLARVTGTTWQVVGIGDFQGDGQDDILWREVETGRNAIWKSGDKADSQAITRVANVMWQVFGTGDYDGDGVDDILWRDVLLGKNTYWRSANSGAAVRMTPVRSPDWKPQS